MCERFRGCIDCMYVCVWHPISRTCCVKIRPLARMERRITREWGAGVWFLCLNSLRMYNLKVHVREISGMYILYVCVWHPISRTCCVKIRPQRPLGIERSVNGRWPEWNADSRESLVRGARGCGFYV